MPVMDEPSITLRSAVPGRVRWEIPALLRRSDMASIIERTLALRPGVISISANAITGRVLLTYERSHCLADMQAALKEAVRRGCAAESTASLHGPAAEHARPQGNLLLRIVNYGEKPRRAAKMAVAAAVADKLFEAAPPALIGFGLDIITRPSSSLFARLGFLGIRSQLIALGTIGVAVWTLDSLVGYLHRRVSAELAITVRQELRTEIYNSIQRMDLARIERRAVTDWLGILQNDVSRIADFFEEGVDPVVTMITNGAIVSATFLRFSPRLAAIQLLTIPALYAVSTKMLKPIRERQAIARADEERLSAALHANLSAMPVVASFVRQQSEAARIEELGKQANVSAKNVTNASAAYIPAVQMVVGLGYLSSLVYGGFLASRGTIPVAAYNMMGFGSLRLLSALGYLGVSLEKYQRTKVAVKRVVDVLDAKREMPDGWRTPAVTGVTQKIEFENVVFGFEPGRPVLRGLNLQFPAKALTGIVGPSGAGKSTILKLLLRFYDVQSGAIKLDGVDIREFRVDELRRMIAQVPQQSFLFPGTLRENIAYGQPNASIEEIVAAARIAEADEFIRKLPEGYETMAGEGSVQLSSGQQQRLAIARAVIANRSVLLFDEATSAVDYETEAAIQRSLETVMAGRTSIMVAHRLSTVRHAELIYVLDEGQVREQGYHDELVRADGIYASMWRVQTGEHPSRKARKPPAPKHRRKARRT